MKKRLLSLKTTLIASAVSLLCFMSQAQTVTLGAWDFYGKGSSFTSTGFFLGDFAATGVSSSSLRATTGTGLLFRQYLNNGLTASRQNTTTLGAAITDGDFISFRITPQTGYALNITSIKLRPVAENGARNFTLFSSRNGFSAGNQIGSTLAGISFGSELVNYNISGHTNITTETEFRVYIWGTFGNIFQGVGIGNKNNVQTGYDLIIEGSATQTTTPFSPSVLKEAQLGLGGLSYYTDPVFCNALYLESRGWMQDGNYTTAAPDSPQFDSNGYPKYLLTNSVTGLPVPVFAQPGQNDNPECDVFYRGRTTLTWEGDADIRITSGTCISGNCTGRLVNGTRIYTIGGTGSINGHLVKIFDINPSNYPKKVRAWLPDPTDPFNKSLTPINGVEQTWHPSYLARINVPEIGVYRFMDLGHTNSNPLVNWSERRGKDHCFMTSPTVRRIPFGATSGDLRNSGISYEMMIDLCNRTGKDAWICVPHGATDDFKRQMARLFRDNLNPTLRIYLELSNEIWACAGSFPQGCYANTQAAAEGIATDVWIGRRFAELWSIWQNEFGSPNRLVRVITNQTGNAGRFGTTIQASIDWGNTLTPKSKPDIMTPTTYFGNDIQRYIFEKLNYKNPTEATYDSAYVEWENRILNSEASQTGRDFTGGGGGFPIEIVNYSKQYNLPIVPYEGGTGLQFADFIGAYTTTGLRCSTYTRAGTPGTQQMELAVLAGECSGGNGNASPYHNFMYGMHQRSIIKTMFYLHNSLGKAKGVRTFSQFGDISNYSKYGAWGFLTSMAQPTATAWRYQHVLEFSAEQATIREIDDSLGTRPRFTSAGELPVGKVGVAYTGDMNYTGGNGALTATVLGTKRLAAGLNIQYQSNRVRVSGTPTEPGTYRLLVRILDADRDPAYSVFTIRILPAPKNKLMATDNFGTTARALQASANGFGFSAPWSVQNSSTVIGIATASSMSYSGLYTSGGGYIDGKNTAFLSAGRSLSMTDFDYLVKSSNSNVVGQTNSSLWISYLVRRETGAPTTQAHVYLNNGINFADANQSRLRFGVSNGKWAIWVRNAANNAWIITESSVTANNGTTNLIAAEVRFGNVNDTIRVFVNPTQLGGNAPATPTFSYITTFTGSTATGVNQDMEFNSVVFYGNNGTAAVQVDDIRLGDTYRAVTPTTVPREGADEASENLGVTQIFPNPAQHSVSISVAGNDVSVVQFLDLEGKVALQTNAQHQTSLDISHLPRGMYLVKVISPNKVDIKKLIVE